MVMEVAHVPFAAGSCTSTPPSARGRRREAHLEVVVDDEPLEAVVLLEERALARLRVEHMEIVEALVTVVDADDDLVRTPRALGDDDDLNAVDPDELAVLR